MRLRRRAFLRLVAGSFALPAITRLTHAESFPSRPVTMVVPFAAGGGTDIFARILAEGMRGPLAWGDPPQLLFAANSHLGGAVPFATAAD